MTPFLLGLLASSSLLLGAAIVLVHRFRPTVLGVIMAFGSGTLISAVAYNLVAEAFATSGGAGIPLGLALGSIAFFVGDLAIDRAGGADRKSSTSIDPGSAKAIVLGTVLDGIPEAVVLGVSLLPGGNVSVAVVVAIFTSNLPEAMSASSGLLDAGMAPSRILRLWTFVALVSAFAAWLGYATLDDASAWTISFVQTFAAGAVLTMLADTMMPEAFRRAGPVTGLVTTFGFLFAFAIASWERAG
jgi:zinc transporter, ZIP family